MLTVFRRHVKGCKHRSEGRKYRRCHCPLWTDGFLDGREIRQSLKLRDWNKAQDRVREWEAESKIANHADSEPMTIQKAWDLFVSDCEARNLREPTLRKYRHLKRKMEECGQQHGLRFISEFDLEMLRKFRASWPNKNLSALKKLELLRSFYRFAFESGWIPENWAKKVKNPIVQDRPTLPFTSDETVRILTSCNTHKGVSPRNRLRLRALLLLLRYSGLRIGDAVTLSRERLKGERLFLYTSKTGVPVHIPLPTFVIEALEAAASPGERYYFWTGQSKPKTAISHWQELLKTIFENGGIKNGHAHRMRDTFAVELLLQGVPIERVSMLLGHSSIKVTEKNYSPWVRARQEQLEADVRRAWAVDPVVFAETKGTLEVHGKQERVN
jgi:site-specific recombinase XerD